MSHDISRLDQLAAHPQIVSLDLFGCRPEVTVELLQGLTYIEILNLGGGVLRLKPGEQLPKLQALRHLVLDHCESITSLKPLVS